MPAKAKYPSWVLRLRGSCPKGWSVKNLRGKVFLSVRSGAGGVNATTMTLPIAWAADTVPEAVQMITELHQLVSDGFDLRDALGRIKQPAAAKVSQPSSPSRWPGLLDEFRADLRLTSGLQPTTWKDNYAPFLDYAVMLLSGAAAPANARELLSQVVSKWEDKSRRREIAVTAVRKFLEFGVEVKNLPSESWTVSTRVAKQMKGTKTKRRTVATITDQEILRLIDSLPDDVRCSRWKNALRLMAIYGLRPEELSHLVSREHPNTAEPAVYCTYQKVCGSTKTEPRWLMPLPLKGLTGELVEWNLAGAMAIGQLELPPLSDKYAVRIIEWWARWGLRPGTTKVVADDPALLDAWLHGRLDVRLVRAGKMNAREANGLALVRTMLQASGRDPETPWLRWTQACQGLMATWPILPRHPRDVERIADGCANHSLDAARYGVQWWRAKWKTSSAKSRMGQVW